MSSSDNSDKIGRIAGILATHSDIENEEIKQVVRRIDYVGKDKPDKVLGFLTGTLDDEYTSEESMIGGFGEIAMYYANGDEEIAVEMVLASPMSRTYDRDYLEHLIVSEWEKMGGDTFGDMIGSLPAQ